MYGTLGLSSRVGRQPLHQQYMAVWQQHSLWLWQPQHSLHKPSAHQSTSSPHLNCVSIVATTPAATASLPTHITFIATSTFVLTDQGFPARLCVLAGAPPHLTSPHATMSQKQPVDICLIDALSAQHAQPNTTAVPTLSRSATSPAPLTPLALPVSLSARPSRSVATRPASACCPTATHGRTWTAAGCSPSL